MFKCILIILMLAASANAEETIYYTTNGGEVTYHQIDPIELILSSNPICPEWFRVTDNYSRFELDANGLEWRLHRWHCMITGSIGWTPEPVGKITQ